MLTGKCKSRGCEYVPLLTNRRCINKAYSVSLPEGYLDGHNRCDCTDRLAIASDFTEIFGD